MFEDILTIGRRAIPGGRNRGVEDVGPLGLIRLSEPRRGHLGAEYRQDLDE